MDTMQNSPPADAAAPLSRPEPVLHLVPEKGVSYFRHAWQDLVDGLKQARLGCTLGWLDIKLRYRGSILGPFWLTASTAIMIAAMGVLYAYLMRMDVHEYLPFLTFSLVLWGFASSTLQEGCRTFTSAAGLIHSARMPYTLHVLRATVRNWLTVAHNIPVVAVVFLWFHVTPAWSWTLPIALVVWVLDSFIATLLLAILGARFRDVPPIVASTMQILFFVTPVLWKPALMSIGQNWLLLDPMFPLMEILRAPLTGDVLKAAIWPAALGWSAGLAVLTFLLFARMRARLAYWV
ncbi:ABC transporter permease [Acetobacter senegalensis]|uniref:Lipopolysaccharide transport system permease protein n=1 Tax=Acetobacter senegalensis TaxID=446692 RepID=A0A0U5EUN3_9PROT|nr:ABC transporter permease [Acetobacter senegalensis]MCG4261216.1 ABC transporter permease [Acetobacter senegalensis]MCG4267363.1 ABC transporter permease [Acetobacter senegalensis]MPQ74304.1 ABC transporter permease [Acetobacter senegalensis]CEF41385.1 lipopolysaccharide transport system permease protein [Acetobacter senegalensis]